MKAALGLLCAFLFFQCAVVSAQGKDDAADRLNVAYNFSAGSEGWEKLVFPRQSSDKIKTNLNQKTGRTAAGCLEVSADAKRMIGGWRSPLIPAMPGRKYRVSFWAQTADDAVTMHTLFQAWGEDKKRFLWKTWDQNTIGSAAEGWKQFQSIIESPAGTGFLDLWLMPTGGTLVQIDDIRITEFGDGIPIVAPGIFELTGKYKLMAQPGAEPSCKFPIPLDYREQVPLTFSIVSPKKEIKSVALLEDRPGNWVLSVQWNRFEEKTTTEFEWRSLVLCGKRDFDQLPTSARIPEKWSDDRGQFLVSTNCVQVDDKRIQREAKSIREKTSDPNDVIQLISATMDQVKAIQGRPKTKRAVFLGAVEELEQRGSCTSAANLMAALFRANNVPARVLAGYPGWSGPLQTHYIIEVFVPEYGWYPIESTRVEEAWPPFEQIQVAIIPPKYENQSQARRFAMGGVPYLSLTERDQKTNWVMLGSLVEGKSIDHVCKPVVNFKFDADSSGDWNSATKQARQRWISFLGEASKDPMIVFEADTRFQNIKSLSELKSALPVLQLNK